MNIFSSIIKKIRPYKTFTITYSNDMIFKEAIRNTEFFCKLFGDCTMKVNRDTTTMIWDLNPAQSRTVKRFIDNMKKIGLKPVWCKVEAH